MSEAKDLKRQANNLTELSIVDIGCNLEGVARSGDRVVFVPFCDEGERINARITHTGKSCLFAECTEVLTPSAFRVKPPCIHFMKCGGCDAQHLSRERQLSHKERILKTTFEKFFQGESIPFFPIRYGAKEYGYRNKLQMPISERNGRLIVGFYEKDSHSPVNMTRCLLHGEWADAVIKAVRDYAEFCGVSAYDERTGKGILRHLVARNIDGHIAVTVVINAQNLPKYSELVRFIEYSIKDFSLHISVNTKNTNVILGDTIRTLYGDPRAVYTAEGIRASVSPLSFLQVNDEVRSMIYREVSGLTKGAEIIIDAYSGSGLMTALLSRNAVKAYGIELVSDAVSDAERLMKDNGISNVENLCGDAAKLLPPLIKNLADKKITVVLDPPRKGCEIAVIDALKLALPEKIVYISCNPATLARDISLLKERYTIVSVTPYDMFPNTKHIETVACLKLKIES